MVKANTFEPRILPSEVLFQPCKPTGINTFWFRSPLNSDSCLHKLLYKVSRRTNGNVRITPRTGSRAYSTRVVHHLLPSPVRAQIIGGVRENPTRTSESNVRWQHLLTKWECQCNSTSELEESK